MEDNKVKQLADLLHVSEEEAKNYLEAANGDIDAAIGFFYEENQSPPTHTHAPSSQPPPESVSPPAVNTPIKTSIPKSTPTPAQSNVIRGISDIRKTDPEDEKRDQFYAGGEKSGIAVLDPSKQNRDQLVDQVFQSAQKHGAVPKHEVPVTDKDKFGGTGYTLGNTSEESKVVVPKPKAPGLKTVILTFWTDSFTIDDGPPRKFQDPANADFLNDVYKGVVPRELEALAQGADLNIELIKKK
jgi:UBX domain-containing protein 1